MCYSTGWGASSWHWPYWSRFKVSCQRTLDCGSSRQNFIWCCDWPLICLVALICRCYFRVCVYTNYYYLFNFELIYLVQWPNIHLSNYFAVTRLLKPYHNNFLNGITNFYHIIDVELF
jgi:hypothetical protein